MDNFDQYENRLSSLGKNQTRFVEAINALEENMGAKMDIKVNGTLKEFELKMAMTVETIESNHKKDMKTMEKNVKYIEEVNEQRIQAKFEKAIKFLEYQVKYFSLKLDLQSHEAKKVQDMLNAYKSATLSSGLYNSYPQALEQGAEKYLSQHIGRIVLSKPLLERELRDMMGINQGLKSELDICQRNLKILLDSHSVLQAEAKAAIPKVHIMLDHENDNRNQLKEPKLGNQPIPKYSRVKSRFVSKPSNDLDLINFRLEHGLGQDARFVNKPHVGSQKAISAKR
jgi:hypothetical protein